MNTPGYRGGPTVDETLPTHIDVTIVANTKTEATKQATEKITQMLEGAPFSFTYVTVSPVHRGFDNRIHAWQFDFTAEVL